jgi:hypothetical protein
MAKCNPPKSAPKVRVKELHKDNRKGKDKR